MLRAALAAVLLAAPVAASDISLSLPVDCVPGETCHFQNYVDRDPGPGAADYRCGGLSYDGHDGTDIALPTQARMLEGVNVLAAAPGVVAGMRDGEPDRLYSGDTAAEVAGRECGNGVLLRHADGWETQYCHMKQGSIAVGPGERVERGAVLGQVGLSGFTQFPHLHLSVRHDGQAVDPFDRDASEDCGPGDANLWATPPHYQSGGLLDAGFAVSIPTFAAIQAGTAAAEITGEAPALVLFALAFGLEQGDEMRLSIDGPKGNVIDNRGAMDKTQAQAFRAAGKKRPAGGWPAGRYTGTVTLMRDGATIGRMVRAFSVP